MKCTISLLAILAPLCRVAPSPAQETAKDFVRDVVPVLTRAGCNSGACHGSFQGRGGLRLSLLGFDPQADFAALVQEARGRRVFPAAAEHSLILRKPAGLMAHGGGRKLPVDSPGYRILHSWIAGGMPGPETSLRVERLEATPAEAYLQPGQQTRVKVRAVWSDDEVRDVTSWALYESTRDDVAGVDGTGKIEAKGPGRAALMIRFMGQVAGVTVTVPFAKETPEVAWKKTGFIDEHIQAEWRKLGLEPAPPAGDSEFLRRVYLDLIGTLPTPAEVRDFISSKDADKRDKVIERLLQRPEYVDLWTLKWSDLLRAHNRSLGEKGLRSFNAWLKTSLRENKPADQFVRELILARGNLYQSGPVAFYFVDQTPEDLAETTAQIFLGVRLQCAKCHHHPFEVWSQEDYYGLAAFFTCIDRKDTNEQGRFGGSQSVRLKALGTMKHPATQEPVSPALLGAAVVETKSADDPRRALADWITARGNPYFAKNIVNRYWGYLFGRGLVHPIDDMRGSNPASHPALLDALAADFIAHDYDVKHLLRTLCRSATYQLAAEIEPKRDQDGMFFTHRRPRRLSAEVLLDAIAQVSGTGDDFPNLPKGTRAIALPDPSVASFFLETFGRPRRTTTCECERRANSDLRQVLHLANGEDLHRRIADPAGRVAALIAAKKSDAEIVEEIYLAALSRLPSAAEVDTVRGFLRETPSRKEGFEDLLWTLLNCGEFVFNH